MCGKVTLMAAMPAINARVLHCPLAPGNLSTKRGISGTSFTSRPLGVTPSFVAQMSSVVKSSRFNCVPLRRPRDEGPGRTRLRFRFFPWRGRRGGAAGKGEEEDRQMGCGTCLPRSACVRASRARVPVRCDYHPTLSRIESSPSRLASIRQDRGGQAGAGPASKQASQQQASAGARA